MLAGTVFSRPIDSAEDVLAVIAVAGPLADWLGCGSAERGSLIASILDVARRARMCAGRIEIAQGPEGIVSVSAMDANGRIDATEQLGVAPAHESLDLTQDLQSQDAVHSLALELRTAAEHLGEAKRAVENASLRAQRLEFELEETNRGVLALYAELDDRAERLARADVLKSKFLSYASHELRTPLNGIVGLTRLLLARIGPRSTDEDKQLGFIKQAAEEMREMVNDLLDLAKVEAGKVTVNASEFGLDFVFGTLRGIFRPLLQSEDVNLVFDDTSAVPAIHSDEAKVSQILRNFISNALKFTEQGEVRVWAELRDQTVRIAVKDTGIGIAPEHLDKVFDEFSQIDHPLQRRVKGTGLGLPLCRKLAQLLAGSVEVVSRLGYGSTFTLVLPLAYEIGRPLPETRDRNASRLPKVLVVDDEEIDRYLLIHLINASGAFEILQAVDGQAGIELAQRERPVMVFLDLNLPRVSGLGVLSALQESRETAGIPVVIVTAKTLAPEERAHLESMTLGIISKEDLSEASRIEINMEGTTTVAVIRDPAAVKST